jgi:asparagine synthase (glutamine-hydrolysing)
MSDALTHRGPDESGFYRDDNAFLGHRRLSIVDLATGQQPMSNEDGTCWIVYNGEIYSHADLRPGLEASGHHYKSHCDTETVLHSYEEHGPECVSLFRGMFAFALWEPVAKTLFCARDRLGIKPFYYFFDGRLFVFASEIKALLEHPAVTPELDEAGLSEYLAFGYLSGEKTLFRGIFKLMPGHWMRLGLRDDGHIEKHVERYWDMPVTAPARGGDEQYWVRELRRRLEESVEMRLMSDVPLGMFLSGGLDSSIVAALMSRIVSEPIRTFSVGYSEERYSELSFAQQVASHVGSQHREVRVSMEDFFEVLPKLVWHEDEPITWPSSVPLYFVAHLASKHVKVVLTGEGSDELFAGYSRYSHHLFNQRWLPYYQWMPNKLRTAVRDGIAASRLLSADLRRRLQHTFLGRDEGLSSLLLDNFYCAFPASEQASLLGGAPMAPYEEYLRYWNARAGASPLERLLYADQKTYLVELLMKQDQMSMACSVESRVPYLDHEFAEFAAQVPADLKLRGSGKYIVKKAVEDLLPREIVHRRKAGFPTPMHQWLRDSRSKPLYDLLGDREGLLAACVDRPALLKIIDDHQRGFRDCTDRLWRLLNLQIWGEVFLRRKSPDSIRLLEGVSAGILQ